MLVRTTGFNLELARKILMRETVAQAAEEDEKMKAEMEAIRAILAALRPLDEHAQVRVIRYAVQKFHLPTIKT